MAAKPTQPDSEAASDFDVPTTTTPTAVAESAGEQSPAPAAGPSELPKDLPTAFARLKAAEALPETTSAQQRAKHAALQPLRRLIFAMQQGLPMVEMTADSLVKPLENAGPILKRRRLEELARTLPEVKELLAQCDSQAAELEALRSPQ